MFAVFGDSKIVSNARICATSKFMELNNLNEFDFGCSNRQYAYNALKVKGTFEVCVN